MGPLKTFWASDTTHFTAIPRASTFSPPTLVRFVHNAPVIASHVPVQKRSYKAARLYWQVIAFSDAKHIR